MKKMFEKLLGVKKEPVDNHDLLAERYHKILPAWFTEPMTIDFWVRRSGPIVSG